MITMPQDLTYICPFCDREVRVGGQCPGCAKKIKPPPGKTKKPWEQDKRYDALDLPDAGFDYDGFVAREFGGNPHHRLGVKWYWWWLGVALIGVMAMGVVWMCT